MSLAPTGFHWSLSVCVILAPCLTSAGFFSHCLLQDVFVPRCPVCLTCWPSSPELLPFCSVLTVGWDLPCGFLVDGGAVEGEFGGRGACVDEEGGNSTAAWLSGQDGSRERDMCTLTWYDRILTRIRTTRRSSVLGPLFWGTWSQNRIGRAPGRRLFFPR